MDVANGVEDSDPVDINVGGQHFTVSMETLTSVQESMLAARFQRCYQQSRLNDIYLDRDPEVFGHVLSYLRSGRQFLPNHVSPDLRKKVEIETESIETSVEGIRQRPCKFILLQDEYVKITEGGNLTGYRPNQIVIDCMGREIK